MSRDITELPLHFGSGSRLLGVLTRPGKPDPDRPVVVIPNTGVEHRVGPNRLHVHMARALAAAGYYVLRFDIAGLGDSDPPKGEAPSASQDLREALDALQARGYGPCFTLIGLCSGAHDIHQFGRDDLRVSGLLAIDGYAYATARFKRMLWTARLLHPIRSFERSWRRFQQRMGKQDGPGGMDTDFVKWPAYADTAANYEQMLKRGVHLAFLFTGDVQGEYLYADQHYDAFPFLRGYARVWHVPDMDHTLTRMVSRQKVIALVKDWLLGISA